MQTLHQGSEAAEVYSPAEEAFNRKRRTVGLILAPIVFLFVLWLPLGLAAPAQRTGAILALVVVLWVTEALPLAATALLGPVLAVIMQVAPARQALAPFADPIVFLFIGGFILAQAMFVHGVDRRIAYSALSLRIVGTSAGRMLLAYGGVCTALSMWISNTACTAMMFPIGLSIVAHLARSGAAHPAQVRQFALAMMLMTAFGASIGGIGTPVGTPPNLIGVGMLDKLVGVDVSFFQWMALGVPVVTILFACLMVQFYVSSVRGLRVGEGSTEVVRQELQRLGRLSRGERNVLLAFGITVALWVAPGVLAIAGLERSSLAAAYAAAMPESIAALVGALLLFVLPVDWRARRFTITWQEAAKIDWAVVLLYGGGLAMGELAFQTGLAEAMGEAATSWLPTQSSLALTIMFTAAAIVLSETASNTASANMVIPISIAVAQAAGVRPIEPVLGATLGASMGFMMPISTPPNAIVYSSGYVPIGQMMRHGLILDVVGFVVIVAVVLTLGPIIL
jgi:solute carrier family 13 (sodium-dependent dicarboxylate transporter), member 2/3/5